MADVRRRRVVGVSPLDEEGRKEKPPVTGGIQLEAQVLVAQPPLACYRAWRNLENLPRFLDHIESIAVIDNRRSHWVVSGPGDSTVEWDAEIIEDLPGEVLSWRSLPGAQIENAGSVHFVPAAQGQATEVRVALTYNPPAGLLGALLAKLFGEVPSQQLKDDLELFKRSLEDRRR